MQWRMLVAVSVLGTSALSPSRHATWDASLCSLDMHGENLCLPPTRVRQVERLLPIAIDPTALVWRETHLRLTQVVSRGYIKRPFGIVYVYGHLSIGKSGVLDYAVSRPKFVTVNEVETDRSTGYAPPRLGLLTPPASWQFGAVVLKRGWALEVLSNLPKPIVRRMGWALVREARTGK